MAVRHKPTTRKRDESSIRTQLMPRWGDRTLKSIGRNGVYLWYREYSAKAPAGAVRALQTLSSIFAHGVASGRMEANPAHGIKHTAPVRRDRWLTATEVSRLTTALDRYWARLPTNGSIRGRSGRQVVDIIRLLMLTGCRCSEISQLRWLEWVPGSLKLLDSKTGPRTIPLGFLPEQILARQPSRGKSDWAFPSPRDARIPRSRHMTGWRRIRDMAGLTDVRIHDLRHTWASHAAMSGVPLPVLAKILGHSSTRVTEIYAHIADRSAERAVQSVTGRLAAMMDAKSSPAYHGREEMSSQPYNSPTMRRAASIALALLQEEMTWP